MPRSVPCLHYHVHSTVLPCFFSLGQADDSDLESSFHVEPCPSYDLKLIFPLLAQLPYSVKYFCRSPLILSLVLSICSSFILTESSGMCRDVTEKTNVTAVLSTGRACETSQFENGEGGERSCTWKLLSQEAWAQELCVLSPTLQRKPTAAEWGRRGFLGGDLTRCGFQACWAPGSLSESQVVPELGLTCERRTLVRMIADGPSNFETATSAYETS